MDLLVSAVHVFSRQDDECDGDKKNSPECQKPVSQDSLTIGLAVGLPAAAVIVVLGYFLLRNYRKNKKEDQEHDPDFDENGEATALPDFPSSFGPRKYEMEDPFDNRNSIRYPPQQNYNARKDDGTQSSSASLVANGKGEKYVESFVLPYHHQIGSKVSLDEYARQLGEYGGAYGGTPRSSAYVPPHQNQSAFGTRNSSLSNINYVPKSNSVSPQKSNLKYEQKQKYENIPNHSFSEIQDSTIISNDEDTVDLSRQRDISTADDIEEVSNDSGSFEQKPQIPKFEINYENESDLKVNNAYNPKPVEASVAEPQGISEEPDMNESTDTFNTTTEFIPGANDYDPVPKPSESMSRDIDNSSPFDDDAQIKQKSEEDYHIDGDFDFSNDSANLSAVNTVNNEHEAEQNTANTSASNLDVDKSPERMDFSEPAVPRDISQEQFPQERLSQEQLSHDNAVPESNEGFLNVNGTQGGRKSPRISAFNLLKNDSDEEDANEEYDEDKPIPHDKLSPEQEEELKRMKSVYKLYFDRDNSIKRKDSVKTSKADDYEANYEFQADPDQPLPEVDMDQYLKINKNLQSDTDYSKRLTTTSSIYTDHGDEFTQQQQYNHYLQDQNFQQFYQQHVQSLPPLQSLPHPSDIRQSTIQTYTDYQPRSKNTAGSPPMKQPFNPIETNNVWSPKMNNQGTFNSNDNLHQYSPTSQVSPSVPSASQMARSSVVMLNPVTEITKQRKFKPAGSLPSSHNNNHIYASNYTQQPMYNQMPSPNQQMYSHQQDSGSGDLIPEGKTDVRRMMNTNF